MTILVVVLVVALALVVDVKVGVVVVATVAAMVVVAGWWQPQVIGLKMKRGYQMVARCRSSGRRG